MIPDPLHPAVVHFPIVLMFLLPVAIAAALAAIRRGAAPRRAWLLAVVGAAALSASSWAAVQTGEAQEDRVERAVAHAALEAHEEPAELFLLLTGGMLALAMAGFAGGRLGRAARAVSLVGSLALIGAGAWVGHTGGELAYRHGAAAAYADGPTVDVLGARAGAEHDED